MELRLLSRSDFRALLQFETGNRTWFEAHINPREVGFYSDEGVKKHIEELLSQHQRKVMLPMLIIDDSGEMAGRINLTDINLVLSEAYLGYRIGENFAGRGIAKRAVEQIIQVANELNLQTLIAFASVDNIASQKVLVHNGFFDVKCHANFAKVRGEGIDCIEYHKFVKEKHDALG
ncbi:N-acetyltransferase [Marinomonas rhizomae]|uniref:Ribosomal-protein-alanine N-acetyltransferase n=1 Tax=Marinomonas rhizomae TaxID=491948 RepID=A0A366IZ57_9GAMM|nr:GNAT family N-acetyltransferase [Marinomonas rhizomae]RBP79972.1 ribosomal-protein-alanine N-acetyltransferase [Marinomonas rhizomae]RNF71903.1 N-acetyltransferase [Marinomonas rhizomae]